MEKISFSHNWNNKLHNKAFTTFRLHNPKKYQIGRYYQIELKGDVLGVAEMMHISTGRLHKINEYASYLDTGYSPDEMIKIIKTMYKNKNIDWDNQQWGWCLLRYVNPIKQEKLDF